MGVCSQIKSHRPEKCHTSNFFQSCFHKILDFRPGQPLGFIFAACFKTIGFCLKTVSICSEIMSCFGETIRWNKTWIGKETIWNQSGHDMAGDESVSEARRGGSKRPRRRHFGASKHTDRAFKTKSIGPHRLHDLQWFSLLCDGIRQRNMKLCEWVTFITRHLR